MTSLLAVNIGNNTNWGTNNLGQTFPDLASLIGPFIRNALTLSGLILLVLIMVGGFIYVANAGGDPKKLEQSQGIISNALIGFAIVFTSFFIIKIIEILTGVPILNPNL